MPRASLVTVEDLPRIKGAWRIADVAVDRGIITWLVDQSGHLARDQSWGLPEGVPIVTGRTAETPALTVVDTDTLAADLLKMVLPIEISDRLDGAAGGFGERFWHQVFAAKPDAGRSIHEGSTIVSVTYEDRYLRSPLTVRLLCELLRPLSDNKKGNSTPLIVRTTEPDTRDRDPELIQHDWQRFEIRNDVLRR